jgi:hypothetical protein
VYRVFTPTALLVHEHLQIVFTNNAQLVKMHPNILIIVGAAILQVKDILGQVAMAIYNFIPSV